MRNRAPRASNMAAAMVDPYVERVSHRVTEGLAQRLVALRELGHDADDLGDPDDLAARMLATVPEPSPWTELEDRRQPPTILALRTADDVWVYPAFQLDEHNQVLRGLADVLARFRPQTSDDEWMVASFLAAPQPGLGGLSIVDHLRDGGDLDPIVTLARERAARWSPAS
jgi:hypothetical protein